MIASTTCRPIIVTAVIAESPATWCPPVLHGMSVSPRHRDTPPAACITASESFRNSNHDAATSRFQRRPSLWTRVPVEGHDGARRRRDRGGSSCIIRRVKRELSTFDQLSAGLALRTAVSNFKIES
jgi:hypothetical protein